MTEAVQQSLITAITVIVGSITTAWATSHSANKKTEEKAAETNKLVETKTAENSKKLDAVHETVNGNLSAEKARGDALAVELESVKAQLKRRASKRRSDP